MAHEVLAPGGSLQQALWAYQGGADAVYTGLSRFSARAHASNLSLEELGQLGYRARESARRIYLAMNTILEQSELPSAVETAWLARDCGIHAIIVQDQGLAASLIRHGPSLPLHASTQMAIHNSDGAKTLQDLGFRRIVLARELHLDEIAFLCARFPDLEFEVFVHGALCYASSGLCMASGLLLGRSANRGDCAQICRTAFATAEQGESFLASMNDLALAQRVRELRDAGVHAFKIEGRMKPPAYAWHLSRAYGHYLANPPDDAAGERELTLARTSFARCSTDGYLSPPAWRGMTNPDYAGAVGLPLGSGELKNGRLSIQSNYELHTGDGLQILLPGAQGTLEALRFAAQQVQRQKDTVSCLVPADLRLPPGPFSVSLVSRHDGKLAELGVRSSFRMPVPTRVSVARDGDKLRVELSANAGFVCTMEHRFPALSATGSRGLESSLAQVLVQSGAPYYADPLQIDQSGGPWFVPPAALKALRRDWFDLVAASARSHATAVEGTLEGALPPWPPLLDGCKRRAFTPRQEPHHSLGFVACWRDLDVASLQRHDGALVLPLAPFVIDDAAWREGMVDFLRALPEEQFILGLGNPAHVEWLRTLPPELRERCRWYMDYGFHCANSFTAHAFDAVIGPPLAVLPWLERGSDDQFRPPLFISRTCVRLHSLPHKGTGHPCRNCSGNWSTELRQSGKPWRVIAVDCLNYWLLDSTQTLR